MNLEHADWFFTRLDIIEFLMTQDILRFKYEKHIFCMSHMGRTALINQTRWWWARAEEAVRLADR